MGVPQGAVQEAAGGKMQGGGIGKEAGVQCFGREVLPGTRIGQGIGMVGETDRRGCFGGKADVPGVDADGIQFPLDAAAEGVVSQLGQEGGMTAQPSDRGAECGDASADLCAERPGLRQRSGGIGGREAKPDFPDAIECGHNRPLLPEKQCVQYTPKRRFAQLVPTTFVRKRERNCDPSDEPDKTVF